MHDRCPAAACRCCRTCRRSPRPGASRSAPIELDFDLVPMRQLLMRDDLPWRVEMERRELRLRQSSSSDLTWMSQPYARFSQQVTQRFSHSVITCAPRQDDAPSQVSCVDRRPSSSCGRPLAFTRQRTDARQIQPKKVIECAVRYPVITTVFGLDDQSVEIARRGIFTPRDWAVPFIFSI